MSNFKAPADYIGSIDSDTAASLISDTSDIAIVIDAAGIIRDLSVSADGLRNRDTAQWIGKRWLDIVNPDSQDKVAQLLSNTPKVMQQQRQINHLMKEGDDLMLLYSVVMSNDEGFRVAVGRDLSSLTKMQQRLVNAQQSLDRDYIQLRQFETQYRLLFNVASDAIIITCTNDFSVLEANPAASALFEASERKLVGSSVLRWFDGKSRQQVDDALSSLRTNGRNVNTTLELGSSGKLLLAHLVIFKTNNQSRVLIRLEKKIDVVGKLTEPEQYAHLLTLVENAPDALVVTDLNGKILTTNSEFLEMSQLASAELASGQKLSDWLGQNGIDFQIIMSSLREYGSVRLYTTHICGEFGSFCEVEVSAVEVSDSELDCMLFSIRDTSRRVAASYECSSVTPKSIEQLTQLVGRVPLKELVRESTELIELLCIQSALKSTNNNRASAAELLGLSRQSLYVKLRRYSIDE